MNESPDLTGWCRSPGGQVNWRKAWDWGMCCSWSQKLGLQSFSRMMPVPAKARWFCVLFRMGRYINSPKRWARAKKNQPPGSASSTGIGKRLVVLLPVLPSDGALPSPVDRSQHKHIPLFHISLFVMWKEHTKCYWRNTKNCTQWKAMPQSDETLTFITAQNTFILTASTAQNYRKFFSDNYYLQSCTCSEQDLKNQECNDL